MLRSPRNRRSGPGLVAIRPQCDDLRHLSEAQQRPHGFKSRALAHGFDVGFTDLAKFARRNGLTTVPTRSGTGRLRAVAASERNAIGLHLQHNAA